MLEALLRSPLKALFVPVELDYEELPFFRKINAIADQALQPLYYFGNIPTIQIVYAEKYPNAVELVYHEWPQEVKWKKTLWLIASFIPGLILGCIGKLIALTNADVRSDIKIAGNYMVDLMETQANIRLSSAILIPKHIELRQEILDFYDFLKTNQLRRREIWEETSTLWTFDRVFDHAAEFMETLFKELERCGKKAPEQMASLLSIRPYKNGDPVFGYCYFKYSIWDLYQIMRNKAYFETHDNGQSALKMEHLTEHDVLPFCQEDTLQSKWMKRFNKLVSYLDKPYQVCGKTKFECLRDHLKDSAIYQNLCNVDYDNGKLPPGKQFFALDGSPQMLKPDFLR